MRAMKVERSLLAGRSVHIHKYHDVVLTIIVISGKDYHSVETVHFLVPEELSRVK